MKKIFCQGHCKLNYFTVVIAKSSQKSYFRCDSSVRGKRKMSLNQVYQVHKYHWSCLPKYFLLHA